MKKIIFFAVSVLLFSNCAKKASMDNLQDSNAELIQNNSTVQTLTDEKESDIISGITIEKISFYIYNELIPKWKYNGYEDLYRTYNITGNNILNESSIENWNSPGNFIILKKYN